MPCYTSLTTQRSIILISPHRLQKRRWIGAIKDERNSHHKPGIAINKICISTKVQLTLLIFCYRCLKHLVLCKYSVFVVKLFRYICCCISKHLRSSHCPLVNSFIKFYAVVSATYGNFVLFIQLQEFTLCTKKTITLPATNFFWAVLVAMTCIIT